MHGLIVFGVVSGLIFGAVKLKAMRIFKYKEPRYMPYTNIRNKNKYPYKARCPVCNNWFRLVDRVTNKCYICESTFDLYCNKKYKTGFEVRNVQKVTKTYV